MKNYRTTAGIKSVQSIKAAERRHKLMVASYAARLGNWSDADLIDSVAAVDGNTDSCTHVHLTRVEGYEAVGEEIAVLTLAEKAAVIDAMTAELLARMGPADGRMRMENLSQCA